MRTIDPLVLGKIHNKLKDDTIHISADETTDSCYRYIANLIVGALKLVASLSYLVASEEFQRWPEKKRQIIVKSPFFFLIS